MLPRERIVEGGEGFARVAIRARVVVKSAGSIAGRGRFDRAVSLGVDPLLDLESKAGIVGIVMAAAANLLDHAGIAFVAEREDGADALGILADVFAARPVAGLTADAREIRMGGDRCLHWEAALLAVGRRMALETLRCAGLSLLLEAGDGVAVGTGLPGLELGYVATLAGIRSDVFGARRQQLAAGSGTPKKLAAFRVRERGDSRMTDPRVERVEVEAERMGGVCPRPFISMTSGLPCWTSRMFLPGELSFQTTLPVLF